MRSSLDGKKGRVMGVSSAQMEECERGREIVAGGKKDDEDGLHGSRSTF